MARVSCQHAGPRLLADVTDRTTLTQGIQAVAGAAQAVIPSLAWPTARPRSLTSPWWRDTWPTGPRRHEDNAEPGELSCCTHATVTQAGSEGWCAPVNANEGILKIEDEEFADVKGGATTSRASPGSAGDWSLNVEVCSGGSPESLRSWLPTVCLSTEEGRSG
jgi:hypothetical protein